MESKIIALGLALALCGGCSSGNKTQGGGGGKAPTSPKPAAAGVAPGSNYGPNSQPGGGGGYISKPNPGRPTNNGGTGEPVP